MTDARQTSDAARAYRKARHAAGLHRESDQDSDFFAWCRCRWTEGPGTVADAAKAIERHLRETADDEDHDDTDDDERTTHG